MFSHWQYHWDKAFHFPGKFHVLVKIITDSVRLGVVYLNLVFSTANGVMFCEIYLQSVAHITTIPDLFILFTSFFLTDPRSPILHHRYSILIFQYTSKFYTFRLFFWSNHFPSNQRFQVIEFVERPVPEKLDMGFLCAASGATSRVRDSQVQSYPYNHIYDTHVTLGWISTDAFRAPHVNARKF